MNRLFEISIIFLIAGLSVFSCAKKQLEEQRPNILFIMSDDHACLDNNTFVIFCSDNGPLDLGSNGKLSGYKTSLWEGGIRVPAIAWYPPKISAGTISKSHLISMDLMPTLLTIAGTDTDIKFDGMDFSDVLFNNEEIDMRPLFWRYNNQWAVRKGNWKYLKIGDEELLFNLKTDISESANMIDENSAKAEELKELLNNWEKEMGKYKQQTN